VVLDEESWPKLRSLSHEDTDTPASTTITHGVHTNPGHQ
jgi:hypothetical protein